MATIQQARRQQPLPELNTDMILDLIWWAEGSRHSKYAGWGKWYQNAWATITNRTDKRINWRNYGATEAERVAKAEEENVCNTSFCMAGQAVIQSGYRLDVNKTINVGDAISATDCVKQVWTGEVNPKTQRRLYEDVGPAVNISRTAQEILGLTVGERESFFAGDNNIHRLKRLANGFALERGLPTMFPSETVERVEYF